jgi:hypothetical protein
LAATSATRRKVQGAPAFLRRSRRSPSIRLDQQEEVGPDRLRTGKAAPDAARQGVRQDQRRRGEDHQPGDVVQFLRPDLDEEGVEPAVLEIEQDRLARLAGAAVPAQKRSDGVDPEGQDQHRPFEPADAPLDRLRHDLSRHSRGASPLGALAGVVDLDGKRHIRT